MTALPPDLQDEASSAGWPRTLPPEERAEYGPLLKELAEQNARLPLQQKQQLAQDLSAQP